MSADPSSSEPSPSETGHQASYVVVARRYRPRLFEDLVGQQHIATALINAINTNRVGHAYLFTGARGVGKTSTARIFAKALNSPGGPTPHPDNDSDICLSIDSGEDVDVLEIDGASNRGIEEIRQLRSNVNIRPSRARFKIYIIDEVHMLTTPAFNALLKTLEEPPEHVKFIFCTTDPQKIPITVLSRCQRFDFAPVNADEIVGRLKHIVEMEGRAASDEALALLARRAAGSMRDSQSLLEQLLAYCSGQIEVDDVHDMLGTAQSGRLVQLVSKLADRDAASALVAIENAVAEGVDCGQLSEQLLGFFRDMMAATVGCDQELLRHTDTGDQSSLAQLGKQLGLETVLAILQILDQTLTRMRQSTQPRTLLEIALVRICNLDNLDELANLIAALRSNSPATSPAGQRSRAKRPVQAASQTAGRPAETEKKTKDREKVQPDEPIMPVSPGELTPETAEAVWKQVLSELVDMTADMAGYYDHVAIPAPDRLVVRFREGYTLQKESCESPDRKATLEEAMSHAVGRPVRIDLDIIPETQPAVTKAPTVSRMQLVREKEQDPLVQQAIELFDAEVTRVDASPVRPSTRPSPG
jgi:DNA polymerase-3 subunit gamma/tau